MTGQDLKRLIERVRGVPPTHICAVCGTLRTDVEERCDLHPEEEPVQIHSKAWPRVKRKQLTEREKFTHVRWKVVAMFIFAVIAIAIARPGDLASFDGETSRIVVVAIPVVSWLLLRVWLVPWARRNAELVRPWRRHLSFVAWVSLPAVLLSLMTAWSVLWNGAEGLGPLWWIHSSVPLFLTAVSLGWRFAELEPWSPPERPGPFPARSEEPRVGRIAGEAGHIVGYYLVGRPTSAHTLIDGWMTEVDFELDDQTTVRMRAGPLRMLSSEGASPMSDAQLAEALGWYWNESTDPEFFLEGAELHVVRAGDALAMHREPPRALTHARAAGRGYRGAGDVFYDAAAPHYLEQV